jgi:hypothetical protein
MSPIGSAAGIAFKMFSNEEQHALAQRSHWIRIGAPVHPVRDFLSQGNGGLLCATTAFTPSHRTTDLTRSSEVEIEVEFAGNFVGSTLDPTNEGDPPKRAVSRAYLANSTTI